MPNRGWKRKAFKRKTEGDPNSKEMTSITKESDSSENSVFNSYTEAMKDKNRFVETAIKQNLMHSEIDNNSPLGRPCAPNKSNTSLEIKPKLCRTNRVNKKVKHGVTVPIVCQHTNDDKDDRNTQQGKGLYFSPDTAIARRRQYEDKLALRHMVRTVVYSTKH